VDIDDIKDDLDEILAYEWEEECTTLFAKLSDDERIRNTAKLLQVMKKIRLYCEFFEAKTFEFPEGKPIRERKETGLMVRVRLCSDDKTYLGFLIGDAPLSSSVSMKQDSILCTWAYYNPAILVPSLKKVVYGNESWWSVLKPGDELKDITEEEISNIWYVKAFNDHIAK
jgi:hypothetical protein